MTKRDDKKSLKNVAPHGCWPYKKIQNQMQNWYGYLNAESKSMATFYASQKHHSTILRFFSLQTWYLYGFFFCFFCFTPQYFRSGTHVHQLTWTLITPIWWWIIIGVSARFRYDWCFSIKPLSNNSNCQPDF